MVFVLSYPINRKKIIENYFSKEMTWRKFEYSLRMKFKILLLTWSINIINTSVQVAAEFWMLKKN